MTRSVTIDGDHAVICIPLAEVHALRVALHPIRVGEPTSIAIDNLRQSLGKALAQLNSEGK